MLFDKLSPTTDFISKIQSDLFILNKNVLYITHECDKIKKLVNKLIIDKNLQHTVDKYFDQTELDDETSPQTESDEH